MTKKRKKKAVPRGHCPDAVALLEEDANFIYQLVASMIKKEASPPEIRRAVSERLLSYNRRLLGLLTGHASGPG